MRKTITIRHCEIPDALRERADAVLDRLAGIARRPHDATIVFDLAHGQPSVEIRIHLVRGEVVRAAAQADDHRTALDRAEEKLRPQLERASVPPGRRRPETDRV
ncbi:MAG TPA: HPF/RaiA family ribosome-associated protein [Gemmatimonadales bacterium]|nr:HPF/RaiA family ribosome-associated protein [Gemmatimonadales bacterium]